MNKRTCLLLILTIVLVLMGIGIMAYPIVASRYADSVRSEVHTQYEKIIENTNESELAEIRESARTYNQQLFARDISVLDVTSNGYFEEMNIPGMNGVMGYIHIPRLAVVLPIYHGVGNDALSAGCGHMPQSSLPVGGANTHAVISAHTGMASGAMFTDIELLKPGDIFQLEVLGERLTYEIQCNEDIKVVLPTEVDTIQIRPDEDLLTLVTCTPYGVNTHRLLVTGHRISTPEGQEDVSKVPDTQEKKLESVWSTEYWHSMRMGVYIVIGMIAVSVIILLIKRKSSNKGEAK